MPKINDLIPLFEALVGDKIPCSLNNLGDESIFEEGKSLGYSQFNELLLFLGFDRVSPGFFQFLINGEIIYKSGSSFESLDKFKEGINRFIQLALLNFGSIKFAYKVFSKKEGSLQKAIEDRNPIEKSKYKLRHKPINEVKPIPKDKTYLLGYLIEQELKSRIEKDSKDIEAISLLKESEQYKKIGIDNHYSYLASDHLDIYIATSMRHPHEYVFVNELADEIFSSHYLNDLNLRHFDPTQAYCKSRIDKGLSEALMLKRAICTLYLAQESDTLGKDSELASTLAQGKPVIAYVPIGDKKFVNNLLKKLQNGKNSEIDIIIGQLKLFAPNLAWENENFQIILQEKNDVTKLKEILYTKISEHYEKRAKTLKEDHPLGIQVNLDSGVANGVLVVRNVNDCAKLIKSIVTNTMEFIIENDNENSAYVYLKEIISGSIFRVKTGDSVLTNCFWNFYI